MAFVQAAEDFDLEKMETVLKEGGNINEQNLLGDTALHICQAREDFVQFLLNHKADPNVQNNMGSTPLHRAAATNQYRLVNTLLKAKADPNIKNNLGFYPEAYANFPGIFNALVAGHKTEDTIPLLQKSGAVIGKKGSTLQRIRAESGAFVDVPKNAVEACAIVTGRPEAVKRAKELILQVMYPKRNQDDSDAVESGSRVKCPIPKGSHGRIIGKGGSTLKKLQEEFQVKIVLPKQNDSSNVIEVFGEMDNIHNAVRRLHEIASKNYNSNGDSSHNQGSSNQKKRTTQKTQKTQNRSNTSRPIPQKTSNTLPINHR